MKEEAFRYLIENMGANPVRFQHYGYDLYLPNAMRGYAGEIEHMQHTEQERRAAAISPAFYLAAFDLCRMGVIRPGIRSLREQETADGSAGNRYSLTDFGRAWLSDTSHRHFVPTEPEKFAALLAGYQTTFGPGYHQRAQEALRDYRFGAYLSCCAMCGAAAESILLALAIAKEPGHDEETVLRTYRSASGRRRIIDSLIGNRDQRTKDEFAGFSNLLNYWRDESAHGTVSAISENEAFTSLSLLLRFALFANEHWDSLTT